MGLLDKLFGGGTKLELLLDEEKFPMGGTVSGKVILSGGKKTLQLKTLKTILTHIKTTKVEGQAIPKIDVNVLIDQTIASDQSLEPASQQEYSFNIVIPSLADTTGEFMITATADIPGVKDPTEGKKIKIIGGTQASTGFFGKLTGAGKEDALLAQYPGLISTDASVCEQALKNILSDMSKKTDFSSLIPLIAKKMGVEHSDDVRAKAIELWSELLKDKAGPDDIKLLDSLCQAETFPKVVRWALLDAVARLAHRGSWYLVEQLVTHQDEKVRAAMVSSVCYKTLDTFPEKKTFVVQMAGSADPKVRAEAVGCLYMYSKEPEILAKLIQISKEDTEGLVQAKALEALARSQYHSNDAVLDIFLEHAKNNTNLLARVKIANVVSWFPTEERTSQIFALLVKDANVEVRRELADNFYDMQKHPEFFDGYLSLAKTDTDEKVRASIISGMKFIFPAQQAIAFVAERLPVDNTEAVCNAYVSLLGKFLDEPAARSLMTQLASSTHPTVARNASSALK